MSDIPSRLSQWEPSRTLKASFLALAALSIAALFVAKLYSNFVVWPRRIEDAVGAVRMDGAPAPAFTLPDLDGRPVTLASLEGKVVFVNFWATWCAPCREEMPSLAALARMFDPNDVAFVAVSVDETIEPVHEFLGPGIQPYRVLHDADSSVATSWGTTKFPESWILDRDGRMLYRFVGARDWTSTAAVKVLERAGARRRPALKS